MTSPLLSSRLSALELCSLATKGTQEAHGEISRYSNSCQCGVLKDSSRLAKHLDKFAGRRFLVGILESVDTTLHVVRGGLDGDSAETALVDNG